MTQKQPKRNHNWKIRKTTTIQLGWKAFIENNKRSKHWHNCEFIHKRSLLYSPRKECTWWMRSTWCTATVAPDQANFTWSSQASKVANLIRSSFQGDKPDWVRLPSFQVSKNLIGSGCQVELWEEEGKWKPATDQAGDSCNTGSSNSNIVTVVIIVVVDQAGASILVACDRSSSWY